MLLISSAALVQPRLEGQPCCLACGADYPGSPAQPDYPLQQAAPNPTLSPVWLSSSLLHATGAEGFSPEPDFLGSGQHSMTVHCTPWQGLASAGGLQWLALAAGFDGITLGGRQGRALAFASPLAET